MRLLNLHGLSDFWINVSKLATGTILSQLIGILLTPVITRIFDAKDIGMLNVFNQIVGILVVISVLRLDRAIVLAHGEESQIIIRAGIKLISFFTLFILLITLPFAEFWFHFLNLKYPPVYILAIPLAFLLQSIINLFKAAGNTFKLYGVMASAIILQSAFVHVFKIGFGLELGKGPAWLILAEILAGVTTILFLWRALYKRAEFRMKNLPFIELRKLLKKEKSFLKFDVPAALLNFLSWSIATFLLAYYYDATTVGYYALGFTMLRLPMNLLGKAIGDVFYKNSANDISDIEKLRSSSSRVVIHLFSFGLLPMAAIFFFGDVLFSFFFGKTWITAGQYSQILSIWTLVWFISSPISNLYYVLGLQQKFLQFMGVSLVLRGAAIIVGAQFFQPEGTLILYSLASLIIYGYQVFFLLGKLKEETRRFFLNLWRACSFAVFPIFGMLLLHYLSFGTPIMMSILFPMIGISMAWRWFKKPKLSI
jgi:O-antigen/teichoic acid export membrane protein